MPLGRWGAIQGWDIESYKLLHVQLATRIYCTTQEIQPIFCNNCKWSVTFKNYIKIFFKSYIKKFQNLKNLSGSEDGCIQENCLNLKMVPVMTETDMQGHK